MKKFCLLIITIILFLCTGCSSNYKFLQNTTEIKTIEIVKVEYSAEQPITFTTLSIIEDKEAFLQDFSQISCRRKSSSPFGVDSGEIAIKILYNNGEYELITRDAQSQCLYDPNKEEMYYMKYKGWFYFDKEGFSALLTKYMASAK